MTDQDQVTPDEAKQIATEMAAIEAETAAMAKEGASAETDPAMPELTEERAPGEVEGQQGNPEPKAETPEATPKTDTPPASEQEQPKAEKPSRYAERQAEIKAALEKSKAEAAEAAKLKAEAEERIRKAEEAEARLKQASRPKFTPEQVEAAATSYEQKATAAEDAGDFDKADEFRRLAKMAREEAANLRNNPELKQAQEQAAREEAQLREQIQQWGRKAYTEFPDVMPGKPLHKAMEQVLMQEPDIMQHPKGVYYAARLVAAESKAGRVSEMEGQVKQLNEELTRLRALVAPGGTGPALSAPVPKAFNEMSVDEQLAEMERDAMRQSGIRA